MSGLPGATKALSYSFSSTIKCHDTKVVHNNDFGNIYHSQTNTNFDMTPNVTLEVDIYFDI